MIRLRSTALVLASLCTLTAAADRGDLSDAPPIRGELNWRAERHQISPLLGFSINDEYQRSLSAGLTYRYYFNNWVGVGLDFMATYLALDTGLTESIETQLSVPGRSGRPSTSTPGFLVGAGVTFVPLYGKMMWFGTLPVTYDMQVIVGAGYATTNGEGRIEDGGSFSPMVGLGARLFFADFVGVELGFRDYIINMARVAPASVVNPEKAWVQNFMVTLGVSFFFPPDLENGL